MAFMHGSVFKIPFTNPSDTLFFKTRAGSISRQKIIVEKIKRVKEDEIVGVDFSGIILTEVDLSGITFRHCNFRNAVLRESNFSESRFYTCQLDGADFVEANLTNANIDGSSIRYIKLHAARCTGLRGWTYPEMVLADFGNVRKKVTRYINRQVMRFHAQHCHNDKKLFDLWASNPKGPCPYGETNFYAPGSTFEMYRTDYWDGPAPSLQQLVDDLFLFACKDCDAAANFDYSPEGMARMVLTGRMEATKVGKSFISGACTEDGKIATMHVGNRKFVKNNGVWIDSPTEFDNIHLSNPKLREMTDVEINYFFENLAMLLILP